MLLPRVIYNQPLGAFILQADRICPLTGQRESINTYSYPLMPSEHGEFLKIESAFDDLCIANNQGSWKA